jgi:hypothetical protein
MGSTPDRVSSVTSMIGWPGEDPIERARLAQF